VVVGGGCGLWMYRERRGEELLPSGCFNLFRTLMSY